MDYKPKGPSLTDRLLGGYKQKKADKERKKLERIFDSALQTALEKMEVFESYIDEKNRLIDAYTPVAKKLLLAGKETEAIPYCNDIGAAQEEIKILQGELEGYNLDIYSLERARDAYLLPGNIDDEMILQELDNLDEYVPKLGIEVNQQVISAFARFRRKKTVGPTERIYQSNRTYTEYGDRVKKELLAESNTQAKAVSKRREDINSELDKFEEEGVDK